MLYIKDDKSPEFYKKYPKLFSLYYPNIEDEKIDALSKSGYYYYHSVLSLDSIIDDRDFKQLPKMMMLQEESIKILTSIYGLNSSFWEFWNKRKNEYFEAVKIEKSLSFENEIDFRTYEDLADKKSAFGKIAIDALYRLDLEPSKETYKALLQSHKHFSVGFQLYDDITDFKEDFEKGQFNYAIYKLKKKIDFNLYKNNSIILNKLLFINGIGQEILTKSIVQFQKALSILWKLKIESKWLETVIEMKETVENDLDTTNGYLATIKAKLELKNKKASRL